MNNNLETLLYEALEKPPIRYNWNNDYLYLELLRLQEIAKTIIELYWYCEWVEEIVRIIASKQNAILKNLPLN